MPYKKKQDGTIDLNGRISEWIQDFQLWYKQDLGDKAKIEFSIYLHMLIFYYISIAKEKWGKSIFLKSKIKTIENMVTTAANGSKQMDALATLDFLAENLESDIRINFSQQIRTRLINEFRK